MTPDEFMRASTLDELSDPLVRSLAKQCYIAGRIIGGVEAEQRYRKTLEGIAFKATTKTDMKEIARAALWTNSEVAG